MVPSAHPSTPQPRVTIFLEQFTGHRLWYVRLLCDALVDGQRQVSVRLPDQAAPTPRCASTSPACRTSR